MLADKVDVLAEDLKKMSEHKQWQILSNVAKFVLPALSKAEDKVEVSGGYNITVSFEDSESAPERDNDSEDLPF